MEQLIREKLDDALGHEIRKAFGDLVESIRNTRDHAQNRKLMLHAFNVRMNEIRDAHKFAVEQHTPNSTR